MRRAVAAILGILALWAAYWVGRLDGQTDGFRQATAMFKHKVETVEQRLASHLKNDAIIDQQHYALHWNAKTE